MTLVLQDTDAAVCAEMEELSARAGSFKPFRTFVKMLRSALQGSSDTVSLDVLTLTGTSSKLWQFGNPCCAAFPHPVYMQCSDAECSQDRQAGSGEFATAGMPCIVFKSMDPLMMLHWNLWMMYLNLDESASMFRAAGEESPKEQC